MLTLHGSVEAAAERYSSRIAVVYDDGIELISHTYLELLRRAQEVSVFINRLGISRATIACLCKTKPSVVGLILGYVGSIITDTSVVLEVTITRVVNLSTQSSEVQLCVRFSGVGIA